jgi:hypothetical protein
MREGPLFLILSDTSFHVAWSMNGHYRRLFCCSPATSQGYDVKRFVRFSSRGSVRAVVICFP